MIHREGKLTKGIINSVEIYKMTLVQFSRITEGIPRTRVNFSLRVKNDKNK